MLTAPAFAQDKVAPDPYVLLEEAKMKLGEGKITSARDMLEAIDAGLVEGYVQEELAFQRMLLDYSFLVATTNLIWRLEETKRDRCEYAGWLKQEWARYAERFLGSSGEFLHLTEPGQELEFVRFRLPAVTEQNLQDLELFADEMVLTAAIENWSEGKGGLGRALVVSQARVAIVLAAAVHYDKAEAGETLGHVEERLASGVLVNDLATLDWLSRSVRSLHPGWRLRAVAEEADRRIIARTSEVPNNEWHKRARERLDGKPQQAADAGPASERNSNESSRGASG